MAGGEEAPRRVLLVRLVNDCSEAKCVKPACDQAQMNQGWAMVTVLSLHEGLLCW